MSICHISDDVLVLMLSTLPAGDLRVAAVTCSRWRECVPTAAEIRLRRLRLGIPAGHDALPCWLRSLFTVELMGAAVGPSPAHSWREDFVELHHRANEKSWQKDMERDSTHNVPWEAVAGNMRQELEPGGPFSLEVEYGILAQSEDLAGMQRAGWSEDGPQLLMHAAGEEVSQVLVGCYLARCSDFAATMHSLLAEYCSAASAAPPLAPECYCTVRALSEFSNDWGALPTRRVGESFFSVGGASAREALSCYFPDERGMQVEDTVLGVGEDISSMTSVFGLDDSPVVRFLSAAADRNGFHSLMQDSFHTWDSNVGPRGSYEHAGWSTPMLCTVTLVEKHAPGEWEVRPHKRPGLRPERRVLRPQQPLYTVRVSFG